MFMLEAVVSLGEKHETKHKIALVG